MTTTEQDHEFQVEMTCDGCANQVRRVLEKLGSDVKNLSINVSSRQVVVRSSMSSDALLKQIEKTGKPTKHVQRKRYTHAMDEEDSGELLKSTVEALPLLQTLRMLSASHAQLEEASRKISSIATNVNELETSTTDVINLLVKLEADRQQQQNSPTSLVNSAHELVTSLKFDAEHRFNAWRAVAENVRIALGVNDLDAAHQGLQELRRYTQDRTRDLSASATDISESSAAFQAVYAEYSRQLRQAVIIKWCRMPKVDLSTTLKSLMIMKSLTYDTHAELRVLFLECRSQVLDQQIAHIKPSRLTISTTTPPRTTPVQQQPLTASAFIIKLIELHRSFLIDTVTHYNSLLLAEPQQQQPSDADLLLLGSEADSNDNNSAGRSVLYCWLDTRLDIFRQLVAAYIDDDDAVQRMESVYSQLMYFGLSLARIYYDARLEFVALVAAALVRHVDAVVQRAADEFTRRMRSATQCYTMSIWLLDASNERQNEQSSAENNHAAAQQQLIGACKTALETFCRQIQNDALGPIRACALQTVGFAVHNRINIDALDTVRNEMRVCMQSVATDDAEQKSRDTPNFVQSIIEMAAKVERHLRECVEICYPQAELKQDQMDLFVVGKRPALRPDR